ncbi:AAA family ATPase [Sphingobium sp. DC-2]|uniref:AAA family ATPase n=1 Tax=Sphingobium sp. DC-2 TaxID=1303256 RepID=UPI00068B1FBB|nr:AAA family ATPase [Sphingobium sp. DC-2]
MSGKFHVITGGPGSGKSSLIRALAGHGIGHMPEAGRAIIQDQMAIDGPALPWRNQKAFAEMMLAWDLRSYREAQDRQGSIMFDRGIPDVIGYLTLCGISVPDHLRRAADLCRYDRLVFLAPHWPAIYRQDQERHQSPGEAAATCAVMREVYRSLGYDLLPLPLGSVEERVAFVKSRIGDTATETANQARASPPIAALL